MQAHGHVWAAGDVAVHERGVLLAVAVVPEGHDLELAESGRQLGDGGDADADLVLAHPAAVVEAVLVQELLDLQVRQRHSDKIHPAPAPGRDAADAAAPRPPPLNLTKRRRVPYAVCGMAIHDVIVLGAGVAGLQCARRLKAPGADVLVVDRADKPGAGAPRGCSKGFPRTTARCSFMAVTPGSLPPWPPCRASGWRAGRRA